MGSKYVSEKANFEGRDESRDAVDDAARRQQPSSLNSGWSVKERRVGISEEMKRVLKRDLNKLTVDRFPTITEGIVLILSSSCECLDTIQIYTDAIVDMALSNTQLLSEMYSDLLLVRDILSVLTYCYGLIDIEISVSANCAT